MKVGLVLGAGGVLGGAWLTGGLPALAGRPAGTRAAPTSSSAPRPGSMIGALVARRRAAVVHGRPLARRDLRRAWWARTGGPPPRPIAPAGAVFRLHRGLPALGPGLAADGGHRARRTRSRHTPLAAARRLAAPPASSRPTRSRTSSAAWCPGGWVDHHNSGRSRATTGPASACPSAAWTRRRPTLADAVAASCAIPGFYRPGRDRRPPLRGRRRAARPRTSTCSPAAASTS